MKVKKIYGIRTLYTWTCPYCGYTLFDRWDDPTSCSNCGR